MMMNNGTIYYSLGDLLALKDEYLATLDDEAKDDWYSTDRHRENQALVNFFGWLNIRNNTP